MAAEGNYEVNLSLPLPTKREAEICYDALRVETEPPRSKVVKELKLEDRVLKLKLTAPELRDLRVSISSVLEHLMLSIETIKQFGPAVSERYDHYEGKGN